MCTYYPHALSSFDQQIAWSLSLSLCNLPHLAGRKQSYNYRFSTAWVYFHMWCVQKICAQSGVIWKLVDLKFAICTFLSRSYAYPVFELLVRSFPPDKPDTFTGTQTSRAHCASRVTFLLSRFYLPWLLIWARPSIIRSVQIDLRVVPCWLPFFLYLEVYVYKRHVAYQTTKSFTICVCPARWSQNLSYQISWKIIKIILRNAGQLLLSP